MPKKPCAASGCYVLLDLCVPYCPRHTAQDKKDRDQYSKAKRRHKPSRRWYNLAAWRGKHGRRIQQLAKQPLCEFCLAEDRSTLADVADHVLPHREDHALFWFGKLQSLCTPCHSIRKQRIESRSGGVSKSP